MKSYKEYSGRSPECSNIMNETSGFQGSSRKLSAQKKRMQDIARSSNQRNSFPNIRTSLSPQRLGRVPSTDSANGGKRFSLKAYQHPEILSKKLAVGLSASSFEELGDTKWNSTKEKTIFRTSPKQSQSDLSEHRSSEDEASKVDSGPEKVYYRIVNAEDDADSWQADYFTPSFENGDMVKFPRRRWLPRLRLLMSYQPE